MSTGQSHKMFKENVNMIENIKWDLFKSNNSGIYNIIIIRMKFLEFRQKNVYGQKNCVFWS